MNDFKYRLKIKELFHTGLDSDDILAYHGTSVKTIEHLARTGRTPITGFTGNEFCFAMITEEHSKSHQLDHAMHYAEIVGIRRYVLDKLPFIAQERGEIFSLEEEETMEAILQQGEQYNLTERHLFKLTKEAERNIKGIVITLSHKLKDNFKFLYDTDESHRIIIPNGLNIDFISGIEPLGQYEWDTIESIFNPKAIPQ